jgi:hypothetical protein
MFGQSLGWRAKLRKSYGALALQQPATRLFRQAVARKKHPMSNKYVGRPQMWQPTQAASDDLFFLVRRSV